jgi:hypothetical protein
MIEGRPRDSLVQYENPIEVNITRLRFDLLIIHFRFQLVKTLMIPLKSLLEVRYSLMQIETVYLTNI